MSLLGSSPYKGGSGLLASSPFSSTGGRRRRGSKKRRGSRRQNGGSALAFSDINSGTTSMSANIPSTDQQLSKLNDGNNLWAKGGSSGTVKTKGGKRRRGRRGGVGLTTMLVPAGLVLANNYTKHSNWTSRPRTSRFGSRSRSMSRSRRR
jgi:hypothetical protein